MIKTITRNGHDYTVYAKKGLIEITAGDKIVADAEKDDAVEQVFASYYSVEDGAFDIDCPRDLYYSDDLAIAEWLIGGLYL